MTFFPQKEMHTQHSKILFISTPNALLDACHCRVKKGKQAVRPARQATMMVQAQPCHKQETLPSQQ